MSCPISKGKPGVGKITSQMKLFQSGFELEIFAKNIKHWYLETFK
jgi:hypothetical protein